MSKRTISLQDLQIQGDEILREVEAGQQFTILLEGRPVAVLGPCGKRQWVPKAELLARLRDLPEDPTLREDLQD